MRVLKQITVVDTHTAGEPTRIWLSGISNLPGASMAEKRDWVARYHDKLRTFLMQEPRGHKGMCGALLTQPADPHAVAGVIFMDNHRYMDMCGHATIGVATAMAEMGTIECQEGENELALDTPAGVVNVHIKIVNGVVEEVRFRNVPSFHCASGRISLPDIGDVPIDVAYGGNVFVLVEAKYLNVEIRQDNLPILKELATQLLREMDAQAAILHPRTGTPLKPTWVQFYDEEEDPPRNIVIGARRDPDSGEVIFCDKVDRSPCGTGLSAKLAMLYSKGKLTVGTDYWYQSVIGTRFRGRIVAEVDEGVIPEIAGRAFITGIAHLVAEEDDPLAWGFFLPEG